MRKLIALLLAAAMLICACASPSEEDDPGNREVSDNQLYVYNYGDYINPEVIDLFEEEYGVEVIYDVYDTPEEMYPVISNGAVPYDIVCTSEYMIEKLWKNGYLLALRQENIPNISNVTDSCREFSLSYDPWFKYSVPYAWGTVGIGYNSREIPDGELTSWEDLWDEKYYDDIMMIDSLRDIFAVSLKMLGYSLNTIDEQQLREATDKLIEEKRLVYKYATDSIRDFLLNESANIGVIYSGEVLYCQDEDEDIHYVLPEEGSNVWFDCWAIPATSQHRDLAEKWIDFNCRPEISLMMYEYIHYSTPIQGTVDMVEELYPEDLENQALFPDEEALSKCEVYRYLGSDAEKMYNNFWKEIKAY